MMSDTTDLFVGVTWVLALIFGIGGCGAGGLSLVMSTWMVSEFVTSGLFYRCLQFPGQNGCTEIMAPSSLAAVQAFMITMLAGGAVGSLVNLISQFLQSNILRMISGGILLAAGMVGLIATTLYTVNFKLCSEATYGAGFILGWSGAISQLFGSTCTFLSAFRYHPARIKYN